MGDYQDPLTRRATKLIESGRLSGERLDKVREALRVFNSRDAALDEANLTRAEDVECALTFAQSRAQRDQSAALSHLEESRKLRAEFLRTFEAIATEDDLEAVEERWD